MTTEHHTDDCLYCQTRRCLDATEPAEKRLLSQQTYDSLEAGTLMRFDNCSLQADIVAGLPAKLVLVGARQLPRRGLSSTAGQIAMIHAIAHIEFSAINLAWDAVYRFRQMPPSYYLDWAHVAADEARHFGLLADRLNALGVTYGDLPAHAGLWDMAVKTADDVLVRMALVPRAMEARGLDVTPGIARRFRQIGDTEMVDILAVIERDEVDHVRVGTHWFNRLCEQRGLESESTYFTLLDKFLDGGVRPPIELLARKRAGFSPTELDELERRCKIKK